MKKIYTIILFFISFTFYAQTNLILNGNGDEYTSNTSDNADAWDMTPNSTVVDNTGATISSPYKALWNNSTLDTYLRDTYNSGNDVDEQPGSASDGTYDGSTKTRSLKLYGDGSPAVSASTRRLYQKISVEVGEQYTFSMDSRSEAVNIPSEVFMLNEEITTEAGLENGAADSRVDHYLKITNDYNSSKGSANDNTFTNSTFTFTASTTTVVIYVRALLANSSTTEVFYDNISLVKGTTASINDVSVLDVKVYPNPTTGLANISTNENIKSIAVYDMVGRIVLETQSNLETVAVSSFPKGMYLLQLNFEKSQLTKKLIVE